MPVLMLIMLSREAWRMLRVSCRWVLTGLIDWIAKGGWHVRLIFFLSLPLCMIIHKKYTCFIIISEFEFFETSGRLSSFRTGVDHEGVLLSELLHS